MNILLQCSIPYAQDDWHVGRFALLAQELGKGATVVARNREPDERGDDPVLSGLSRAQFDQAWLLAVDGGSALSARDIAGVNRFQREGGSLLTARDHQDMGMWLRQLEGVGQAHFFHAGDWTEPDQDRRRPDDFETEAISWPNYRSGRNGDYQRIWVEEPLHPLMRRPGGGRIELFPAHPHEGAVRAPADDPRARPVARGRSVVTGRDFELVVAFERTPGFPSRSIAESSFHHFADYNWDLAKGAPSFVTEKPGDGIRQKPHCLEDIRSYVRNAAAWLAGLMVG
jgi:hypothetical protein